MTAHAFGSSPKEPELVLPFQREDGSFAPLRVSVDSFPYYLKTDDYSDFYRLAVLQQQFKDLFDWDELKSASNRYHDLDEEQLDEEEEQLIAMHLARYVMSRRDDVWG